nr:hypothetical protein [Catenuloplanes japonicus]
MTVGAALLRQLYGASPDGFTAVRDAAAAEARARGDAAAAKEIAALRKPTIAAWLVNLLAIRRPELLADLAALAGEMRTAQRELRGPELRELSAQRRRVVASLVAEVRALAAASGAETGKLPLNEVEDTLNAALSDEETAEAVRSGRLLRPVTYTGFGEVPRPKLRLVTADTDETGDHAGSRDHASPGDRASAGNRAGGDGNRDDATGDRRGDADDRGGRAGSRTGARPGSATESAGKAAEPGPAAARRAREAERERRVLERAEHEALHAREQAERDLLAAEEDERAAVAAVAELSARIAALQAERAEAEHEAGRRKLARKSAERAAGAARRRHGDAAAVREAAEGPFVERATPFTDTAARKGAARRGGTDRGGAPKAESGA